MISNQLLVPPTVISSLVDPEHWKPVSTNRIIWALAEIARAIDRDDKDEALTIAHVLQSELIIDCAVYEKQGEVYEH